MRNNFAPTFGEIVDELATLAINTFVDMPTVLRMPNTHTLMGVRDTIRRNITYKSDLNTMAYQIAKCAIDRYLTRYALASDHALFLKIEERKEHVVDVIKKRILKIKKELMIQ